MDLDDDEFVSEIPRTENDRPEDYQFIKVELIKIIIKYRVFKIDDLKSLFARIMLYNKHMEVDKLDDMFNEMITELEA